MNISAFVIGVATTFFTIFSLYILLWRERRTRFQTVVGGIMAVWAVWCLKDIVLTFPHMYTPKVLNWILMIDGWSALTYTLLVAEVVMPRWMTLRRFLLCCFPFAAFTVAYALWPSDTIIYAYTVFLWCYAWGVVIVGYVKMRHHLAYIQTNFSNLKDIDVSWLRPFFVFAIMSQLAWLFTSLYANTLTDILYYVLVVGLWCFVLYYSWNFRPIEVVEEVPVIGLEESSSTPSTTLPKGMLERVMEEQRLYLKPDLTLTDLAQALGTNRTYVSNYLSQVLRQTFYDYVNQQRIEHMSIPMMQEHPEYKLEYVAAQSGFASLSTFRRAFVKLTGKTPGRFCQDNS